MNKKVKHLLALVLFVGVTLSCEKNEPTVNHPDPSRYMELESLLEGGLESIGSNLRKENATFNSREIVRASAESYFESNEKALAAFSKYYQPTAADNLKSAFNKENLTPHLNDIEATLLSSGSGEDFTGFLRSKFDEILHRPMNPDEKDFLLVYITLYKTSVEFFSENSDLIEADLQGLKSAQAKWWDNWGRCVAGTLGGAGLGTLTGLYIGSAVPGVGTVAGGIIGGIAGGLKGAVESC